MPRERQGLVTTTISIPEKYLEWIEKNTESTTSAFIRQCVGEKINRSEGFDSKIAEINTSIKEKEIEMEQLVYARQTLEQENARLKEEKEIDDLSNLIAKAIKKIPYVSWQDAANDLDSSRKHISSETFVSLVETIWYREKNGARENVPIN